MHPTPRRLAVLALAGLVACGPSLRRLQREHRYDQALCGAAEGAFPDEQVLRVVRDALGPAVHAAVIPHERLARALGGDLPELAGHALVRIVVSTNTVQLQSFSVAPTLVRAGTSIASEPADHRHLAALFQESVPGPTTTTPSAIGEAGRAIGTVGAVILTVASLGIFRGLLGSSSSSGSSTSYPSQEEIRRRTPRTSALRDAIAHLDVPDHSYIGISDDLSQRIPRPLVARCDPGDTCSSLVLVARADLASGPLALRLGLHYGSRCGGLSESVELPLPPGASLDERLAAVFGDRMRPLSELTRP